MKYATLAQLKQELDIDTNDTSRDGYLQDLLEMVSRWIDTYTNRVFGDQQTVTDELHDFSGGRGHVYLKNVNITGITAVKVGQIEPYAELETGDYSWNPSGRLVIPGYTFGTGDDSLDNLRITYTHQTAVPSDISLACIQLAARIFRNDSVSSERIGDYSVAYKNMDQVAGADQLGILNAHRLRNV